ncbi:hypothetical protein QR680_008666 [Steinernema hermaphroditum]|uniref:EGF-like domain-containing protein n=1 Tax=Steinernema hermaphroditum TaxID=289476 RepID=A0AA39IJV2_9BILA|nr:hypothetical protein QR680_008666 [Steinernema hermaphroditum]
MTSIAESYDEEYRTALYEDDQMLEKLRALMVIREAACPSEYSFVARFFPFGRPNVPANLHCRVKGGCNDADLEELRRKKSKDFEPPPTTMSIWRQKPRDFERHSRERTTRMLLFCFILSVCPFLCRSQSEDCVYAKSKTVTFLVGEYDCNKDITCGSEDSERMIKDIREYMVIREEACDRKFSDRFFENGRRPIVDPTRFCKPEEKGDCNDSDRASAPTTTQFDYVAMVRQWSRADITREDRAIYKDDKWTMDDLRNFRKSVRLWELICDAEAPKAIWDEDVWTEGKPDPWPHSVAERDGDCPNVEPTTTVASTTAEPIDYVTLVRKWNSSSILAMQKEYEGDAVARSVLKDFRTSVRLWEQICGQEAPAEIWDGQAKPLAWPHRPEDRDGKCPNVVPTTTVETTTLSPGAKHQLDGFKARDCSWHESAYKEHIESGRDYMVDNFRKWAAAYEFVCDVKFPDEWYANGKRPTSELTDEKYKGAKECKESKGTTCPYNPGPSESTTSTTTEDPITPSSVADENIKLVRSWCREKAEKECEKKLEERKAKSIQETVYTEYMRLLVLWETVCEQKLPTGCWGPGKPKLTEEVPAKEIGNCVQTCEESTSTAAPTSSSTTTTSTTTEEEPTTESTTTSFISTLVTLGIVPPTELPTQCGTCNEYAKCEKNSTIPGVCEKCACPLGRKGSCCEEIVDLCAEKETNPCAADTPDMQRTCKVVMPAGNTKCECTPGWIGRNCTEKFDPCEHHKCVNGGKCVDDGVGGYHCDCTWEFKGEYCEMPEPCYPRCKPCTSMAWRCENNSTCWPGLTQQDHDFQCICRKGYKGKYCGEAIPCEAFNPCKNGGDCYREEGRVVCECLSIWTGEFCETFNICHDDKCVNGICNPVNETHFTCSCWRGFTGENCEIRIDLCDTEMPCRHNGSCISKIADYECFCLPGTSGKNCEHNFDDCVDPIRRVKNRCSIRDRKATCIDGIDDFTCECSADWTGKTCSMRMTIWDVVKHFKSYDDNVVNMLEDLMDKPELIKETLPFFLALMSSDNQTDISWDHEDLFTWVTFEGQELDLKKDMVKWNAATLGNCFTFNHDSQPEKMPLRYAGEQEGFRALMRVRQDEYLDWIDTASLLVFVHSSTETIFGESMRFQAMPGGETTIMTSLSSFERLGGKFGRCAKDSSEVDSYYYSGDYVTDGCFRSCYQDAVFNACKCMDPRFPLKEGVTACDLGQRSCVISVTEERGDPSNWPECNCPPPCSNGQYNVKWSYSSFKKEDCLKERSDNSTQQRCLRQGDNALITVYMPHIIQNTFREEPKMDFNKFISMLGGLLGVLCGICIITFVESNQDACARSFPCPLKKGSQSVTVKLSFSQFGFIINLLKNNAPYQLQHKLRAENGSTVYCLMAQTRALTR